MSRWISRFLELFFSLFEHLHSVYKGIQHKLRGKYSFLTGLE